MSYNFKTPNLPFNLPWYMFDISNYILITTPSGSIPGDITDVKQIVLAEILIPGMSYQPIQSGGLGNRKISFNLIIIKRDSIEGNKKITAQFENLRNQASGFTNIFNSTSQFQPNPKVLYCWGVGMIPLIWYVSKCDFVHKQYWHNPFGVPQLSEVSIELILDEKNTLNKIEDTYRKISAMAGITENFLDLMKTSTKVKSY